VFGQDAFVREEICAGCVGAGKLGGGWEAGQLVDMPDTWGMGLNGVAWID